MKRSKLKNKFNKYKNYENQCNSKLQRNYCKNLLTKAKKQHYENFSVKDVTANQTFWKSVKLNFSNKESNSNQITLLQKP